MGKEQISEENLVFDNPVAEMFWHIVFRKLFCMFNIQGVKTKHAILEQSRSEKNRS